MKDKFKSIIYYWLALGAFLVIVMVVIGGITRLTHSGLSMVRWEPISGTLPPLSDSEWQKEFEHYKEYPEFQKLNMHFELEDFKSIFWWEYIHRLLGRIIGIIFIVPFVYFLIKKVFDKIWIRRLIILFLLGGLQGFIGWFMVKSGLIDRPSVSHYRLAIHFSAALLVYTYIITLMYKIRQKEKVPVLKFRSLRNTMIWLMLLVALQIEYGAFVAGLKAGFMVNTWPKMGGVWISDVIGFEFQYMGILSLTEGPVTVQLIHRILPYFILIPLGILYFKSTESIVKKGVLIISGLWLGQFLLGIFTLILVVPVSLGVIHQLGAVVLWTVVWVYYLSYRRGAAF